MQVAGFQQQLAQADRGVVGVRQKGVLDDHAGPATGLEHLDEVLQEQEGRLAGADREVLLHFLPLAATEGRISEDHIHPVLVLNVGQVLGERVGVDDVRRFDAVQDHVHDRNHIGQRLLFLAVEAAFLQRLEVVGGQLGLAAQVVEGFAEKAGRAAGAVVNAFADPGLHHLHHRPNQRARGVVLAAIAPGVAHVLDLGFVQVRKFVLLGL